MTLPASGAIGMYDVRTELGNTGQITLNDTDVRALAGVLSGQIGMNNFHGKTATGVWSNTSNLVGPHAGSASFGTVTSAVSASGRSSSLFQTNSVYKYNGSSWSSATGYPLTVRDLSGCGTSTAGLAQGGYGNTAYSHTEEYNGTSWTYTGTSGGNNHYHTLVGTQTAALVAGGFSGSAVAYAWSKKYNGTSWSTTGSLTQAVHVHSCAGSQSSARIMASNYGTGTSVFNGSTWSTSGNSLVSGQFAGASGTSANAVTHHRAAATQAYNGASWSLQGNKTNTKFNAQDCSASGMNSIINAGGTDGAIGTASNNSQKYTS